MCRSSSCECKTWSICTHKLTVFAIVSADDFRVTPRVLDITNVLSKLIFPCLKLKQFFDVPWSMWQTAVLTHPNSLSYSTHMRTWYRIYTVHFFIFVYRIFLPNEWSCNILNVRNYSITLEGGITLGVIFGPTDSYG